jgi:hypothetical protein
MTPYHIYVALPMLARERVFQRSVQSGLLYPLQLVNQIDIIPSSNDVVKVYMFW